MNPLILSEICRACMQKGDSMRSVFDFIDPTELTLFEEKTQIYELFNSVQLPKIDAMDALPKNMCETCVNRLCAFLEFQKCCINSDIELRKLITSPKLVNRELELNGPIASDPLQNEFLEFDDIVKEEVSENDNLGCLGEEELYREECPNKDSNKSSFWTCDVCKSNFSYKKNLQRHMRNTHSQNTSNKIKSDEGEMEIEVEAAENENFPTLNIFTCDKCEKKFSYKKNLRRHLKDVHSIELPKTEQCMKKDIKCDFIQTKAKEAGIYKCDECNSIFHKKSYLRKHKYRHKRPGGLLKKEKSCDICGLEFKTLQSLKSHYMSMHPEQACEEQFSFTVKMYTCEFCNKSFQQSCTLKDHIRVHTKEQPFLCSTCGKSFNSNSNLQQHLLRHTGERRYECPECPKKFPCLSDLSSHKQVHKQLKPHICDVPDCRAAFGKPYQLKMHKMYHNGEKRYQCEYCAMRFVSGDHLRRHIRTHTGEKPYKCKYCTRSFTQSNDMIKHLRSHLGENVYQCERCPATFRLAAELRSHFTQHKNDDEETTERNKRAWLEAQELLRLKIEADRLAGGSSHEKSFINT